MKTISHKLARRLLQMAADQGLQADQSEILTAHISNCAECSAYAEKLGELQNLLRSTMRRQWMISPRPLSINQITNFLSAAKTKQRSLKIYSRFAAISMAIAVFVAMLIAIDLWRIESSFVETPSTAALLIPTPSADLTATYVFQNCQLMLYKVQINDTLDGIAQKFSLPKDMLITYNNLTSDKVSPHDQLKIPICESTPLTASKTPVITTTAFTPRVEITLHTP